MHPELFRSFHALNEASLAQIATALGFAAAACYRLKDETLTFIVGSGAFQDAQWPASFRMEHFNCTTDRKDDVPLGWLKKPFDAAQKKLWPKSTIAYFPEQELRLSKFVLMLVPQTKKRISDGDLDGALEAFVARIAHWTSDAEMRHFINEAIMMEHTHKLAMSTQTLIDHELRTPLSNISGYAYMLSEQIKDPELKQQVDVILAQANIGLNAIEKLDLTIQSSESGVNSVRNADSVPLKALIEQISSDVVSRDLAESGRSKPVEIKLVCSEDITDISIQGVAPLLERAITEVLHNAVLYSEHSSVLISLYRNHETVIIDIEDQGEGVPEGTEDLIFLQFFRGHNNQKIRRGHRGLGLGLYLARYIADQHFGQLLHIRRKERGALFRFLFPVQKSAANPIKKLAS